MELRSYVTLVISRGLRLYHSQEVPASVELPMNDRKLDDHNVYRCP